jgi:LysR family cys regulon transcriptional activator
MALDPVADTDLVSFDASHLFPRHLTWVGFRRGSFLRRYTLDFIQGLAPHLDRQRVQKAERTASQEDVDALFADARLPLYA